MPLLIGDRAGWTRDGVIDAGERAADSGIEQPVVLRVTDAAAEGRQPVLLHAVVERGVGRKLGRAPLLAGDRGVALVADDHLAVLDVEPRGDADQAAVE